MSVTPHWNTERASQPEVGELDVSAAVDEQILRLQIAMQNAVRMNITHSVEQLTSVALKSRTNYA